MVRASGVKCRVAPGAEMAAANIFVDRELVPAGTAKDARFAESLLLSNSRFMASKSRVTLVAGVVGFAAGKLDGDNINGRVPVPAFGPRTDVQSPNDMVVNVARVSQIIQISIRFPLRRFTLIRCMGPRKLWL